MYDDVLYLDVMLDEMAFMPSRAHINDAGYDLRTPIDFVVPAHGRASIDTGVHVQIPNDYYLKLESKSGLNVNHGVVSCGGVIDAGYTGSIVVELYNFSDEDYIFNRGDKIVQMIMMRYYAPFIRRIYYMEETERGSNGFGSTGR